MPHQEIIFKELNPFHNIELTRIIWQSIEVNAEPNFYLSWSWMESWLKSLNKFTYLDNIDLKGNATSLNTDINLRFIYAEKEQTPIFCYFLALKASVNSKIIYAKRAYLNRTGDPKKDIITIEHNGILINKEFADTGFTDVFQKSNKWDELVATFITPTQDKYFMKTNKNFNCRLEEIDKAFRINLHKVKHSDNDLLPLLSSNRRTQIKRTIKAYQQEGQLEYDIAIRIKNKICHFEELKQLHQKSWQAKGKAGAFASNYFNEFHNFLINNSSAENKVEIFTVLCGQITIACLYFLIQGKNLYYYQSGFQYRNENNFRPGLLAHYYAINHYAKLGYDTYDFLAGEMDYKKTLSTENYLMKSHRIRRNKFRFKLEDYLRKIGTYYRKITIVLSGLEVFS